ncbi:MAG: hypothetical protein HZC55_09585 [Verrucomicrobia bacterium]|nr:hypothetical protein [Verrucomicrobiota bacterium]
MNRRPTLICLACTLVLAAGCRREEITTYRVPKEPAPASPHGAGAPAAGAPTTPAARGDAALANTAVAVATGASLAWTAPAHWTAKAGSSMRKGSYAIKGEGGEADMAITAFPGDVGGDLANLNRWRGQLQLPPVGQAEFDASTQHLDRNGLHMTVVDVAGTGANAQRILGAMVPYSGATWFFKLLGPDALVAKEKPAFLAFLDTIKPAAP